MTTLHTLTRTSYVPRTVLDRPSGTRPWIIRAVDLDHDKSDPYNPRVRSGSMIQLTTHDRHSAEVLALGMSVLFDNVAIYHRGPLNRIRRVWL